MVDGNQNQVISEAKTNNITVRKVKKFDLDTYISDCLLSLDISLATSLRSSLR